MTTLSNWLPALIKELAAGHEPVLALAECRNISKVAVLDERGHFLVSDLIDEALELAVSRASAALIPGGAASLEQDGVRVVLERLGGMEALPFWEEAKKGSDEAWAAWLLTVGRPEPEAGDSLVVSRHVLSASGPFTPPQFEEDGGLWSLVPLNACLGQLFVFGDDELALETSALAARAGLKVTLASANYLEFDLKAAQQVGFFNLVPISDWSLVSSETLAQMGVRTGAVALVTTPLNGSFLDSLKETRLGWIGLAGDAGPGGSEPGLFPHWGSAALRALGLVADILDSQGESARLACPASAV